MEFYLFPSMCIFKVFKPNPLCLTRVTAFSQNCFVTVGAQNAKEENPLVTSTTLAENDVGLTVAVSKVTTTKIVANMRVI